MEPSTCKPAGLVLQVALVKVFFPIIGTSTDSLYSTCMYPGLSLRELGTFGRFSAIFYRGDSCDFLVTSPHTNLFWKSLL